MWEIFSNFVVTISKVKLKLQHYASTKRVQSYWNFLYYRWFFFFFFKKWGKHVRFRRIKSSWQALYAKWCRSYTDNDHVPHGWIQVPQTLLRQLYLRTLPTFISASSILQPLCGIGKRCNVGDGYVCQALLAVWMYRYLLCEFHPLAGV